MRSFLTTGIRAPGCVSLLFFWQKYYHVNSNFVNSNFVKSAKIGLCYQFVHGGVLKHNGSQKLSKKIQRKLDSSGSHGCR